MSGKVIYMMARQAGKNTLATYEIQLAILKTKEQEMVNPPLKDWFIIRNEIRAMERKIKEFKNGKID